MYIQHQVYVIQFLWLLASNSVDCFSKYNKIEILCLWYYDAHSYKRQTPLHVY